MGWIITPPNPSAISTSPSIATSATKWDTSDKNALTTAKHRFASASNCYLCLIPLSTLFDYMYFTIWTTFSSSIAPSFTLITLTQALYALTDFSSLSPCIINNTYNIINGFLPSFPLFLLYLASQFSFTMHIFHFSPYKYFELLVMFCFD